MEESAKRSRELWEQAGKYELPGPKQDWNKAIELYEEAIRVDSRNVLAYQELAKINLVRLRNLEKAEYYCEQGYAVTDIPPEITQAPVWLEDIHEEVQMEFDFIMEGIRLQQGRIEEARHYLNNVKAYFDKYYKGPYLAAKEAFDKYSSQHASDSKATSGGPCFIATAVYGSPLAPEVFAFRHFRDQVLLTSRLGRYLVDLYYFSSPPLASLISKHQNLQALTRWLLLEPILYFLKIRR
jgi:hypothetical protein